MPPIDIKKFKKTVLTELPDLREPASFSKTAQPSPIHNQDRFRPLHESERPGLIVSARTKRQIEDDGAISVGPLYRNGLHLFYGGELPNNRFMMRFHKNAYGEGVVAIPQVQNLLQHLPNWEFGYRFDADVQGYISVDIVGMIYIKSHFP